MKTLFLKVTAPVLKHPCVYFTSLATAALKHRSYQFKHIVADYNTTNTTRDTSQTHHGCVFGIFLIILTNVCICLTTSTAAAITNDYAAAAASKRTVVTAADYGKSYLNFQLLNFVGIFRILLLVSKTLLLATCHQL